MEKNYTYLKIFLFFFAGVIDTADKHSLAKNSSAVLLTSVNSFLAVTPVINIRLFGYF
jgi:hypothetical protein